MGTEVNYSELKKKIAFELEEAFGKLKRMEYVCHSISPREFYDYMTGETLTGDTITIVDVLDNEFLMIHEAVEISELKRQGIPINKQTVMTSRPRVYESHYKATDYELEYALSKGNHGWLKTRVAHAKSRLEDLDMPPHLIKKCQALITKFSKAQQRSS
ncbi:MAG: hypothetical protein JSV85_07910 [Candidatus Bathyarchaeota archaeon]|nr:MAG: hypothetical protein JSV85_07910 [Candidatus Bathyarchaeota archaeon]